MSGEFDQNFSKKFNFYNLLWGNPHFPWNFAWHSIKRVAGLLLALYKTCCRPAAYAAATWWTKAQTYKDTLELIHNRVLRLIARRLFRKRLKVLRKELDIESFIQCLRKLSFNEGYQAFQASEAPATLKQVPRHVLSIGKRRQALPWNILMA